MVSINELLPHAEFAFNRTPSKATTLSPFQIVYGYNPRTPLDLVPIPTPTQFSWEAEKRAKEIQELHAKVRERIEKFNDQAKQRANKHRKEAHFQPGDLVWIHLRKERFPSKRKSKLMPRSDGPFEIIEKIGPNAYKVDLPGDYGVSATFNVADLSPYLDEDEEFPSLRTNSNQPGEDDGDHLMEPSNLTSPSLEEPSSFKQVKEIQGMVRNILLQADSNIPSSTGNWPGLVHLLGLTTDKPNNSLDISL